MCVCPPRACAKAGRSSYVPRDALKDVPDPGAMAVAAWLRGAAESLQKREANAGKGGVGGAPSHSVM